MARLLWKEGECVPVRRPDRRKVATIEGQDRCHVQPLSDCNYYGINCPKREVAVLLDQIRGSQIVSGDRIFNCESSAGKPPEKSCLGRRPSQQAEEVRDFSNDERRHHDYLAVALKEAAAFAVGRITWVQGGDKWPRVCQDHHSGSRLKVSR